MSGLFTYINCLHMNNICVAPNKEKLTKKDFYVNVVKQLSFGAVNK